MLHCLRQSATRTSRLLLSLLLLSWLSAFCGNCIAAAGMEAAGHSMPMQHAGHGGHAAHDCCDHPAPFLGTDCDHMQDRPVLKAESRLDVLSPLVLVALLPAQPVSRPAPVAVSVPHHDTEHITPLHPPFYLQNCVFLI